MTYAIVGLVALVAASSLPFIGPRTILRARDEWLLVTLTAGAIALAWSGELWLALIALWFLIHWRHEDLVPSLVCWAAIGATWWLLRTLPAEAFGWLRWAFVAIACREALAVATERERRAGRFPWLTRCFAPLVPVAQTPNRRWGQLGSAAVSAMRLALAFFLAPWWLWPLLAVPLAMLFSVGAFVALAAGCVVLWPWTAGFLAFFAFALTLGWLLAYPWGALTPQPRRWWRVMAWTPRGDSLGPIIGRLRVWVLIPFVLTWAGYGPNTMEGQLRRWSTITRDGNLPHGEAHMEVLHLVYEYGALGGLAALAFVLPILPHLRWGDPWSAAWVVGGVLTLGHWPLRLPATGVVWLTISAAVLR